MSRVPFSGARDTSNVEYQLVRTVNGNIQLGINVASTLPTKIEAPSSANTEFTFNHDLGFVPNGFLVLSKDATCDVYSSRINLWTTSQMYLKCTVGSINLVLVAL